MYLVKWMNPLKVSPTWYLSTVHTISIFLLKVIVVHIPRISIVLPTEAILYLVDLLYIILDEIKDEITYHILGLVSFGIG